MVIIYPPIWEENMIRPSNSTPRVTERCQPHSNEHERTFNSTSHSDRLCQCAALIPAEAKRKKIYWVADQSQTPRQVDIPGRYTFLDTDAVSFRKAVPRSPGSPGY